MIFCKSNVRPVPLSLLNGHETDALLIFASGRKIDTFHRPDTHLDGLAQGLSNAFRETSQIDATCCIIGHVADFNAVEVQLHNLILLQRYILNQIKGTNGRPISLSVPEPENISVPSQNSSY